MDASNSDNVQPPTVGGAFARKRREKQQRDVAPAQTIPEPTPAPVPQPEPTPAPLPLPDPVPDAIPAPEPTPTPTPIPEPASVAEPAPIPAPAPEPEPEPEPMVVEAAAAPGEPMEPTAVNGEHLAPLLPLRRTPERKPAAESPAEQTAVLPRVVETPAKATRTKSRPATPRTGRRLPTLLASILAGAASGGTLMGAIWAFNRWGGQNDSINALQLLGSFVASIVVGVALLALGGIAHRTAIAFLGTGAITVVMMFFPSDNWQSLWGTLGIVVGVAFLYAAAHAMTHTATGDR